MLLSHRQENMSCNEIASLSLAMTVIARSPTGINSATKQSDEVVVSAHRATGGRKRSNLITIHILLSTTCGFALPTCNFAVTTCNFAVTTCNFAVTTCNFAVTAYNLAVTTCNFAVTTCNFALITCGFAPPTCGLPDGHRDFAAASQDQNLWQ